MQAQTSRDEARFQKWVTILHENDSEMSKIAADKLAEMKNRAAVPHLVQAMQQRTTIVAVAAARALGEIGDPAAVPALCKSMQEHWDVVVNTAAAESLVQLRDPAAVSALRQVIEAYLKESNGNRFSRIHSHKRGLFTTALRALKAIGTRDALRAAAQYERAESIDIF